VVGRIQPDKQGAVKKFLPDGMLLARRKKQRRALHS
jgi:hypothetical protein